MVACWCGRRRVRLQKRTTAGTVTTREASTRPKSVSAETSTRPSSCPAAAKPSASSTDRHWSTRNFKRDRALAPGAHGGRPPRSEARLGDVCGLRVRQGGSTEWLRSRRIAGGSAFSSPVDRRVDTANLSLHLREESTGCYGIPLYLEAGGRLEHRGRCAAGVFRRRVVSAGLIGCRARPDAGEVAATPPGAARSTRWQTGANDVQSQRRRPRRRRFRLHP